MARKRKQARPSLFAGFLLFLFSAAGCTGPAYTLLVNTYAVQAEAEAPPFPAGARFAVLTDPSAVNPLLERETARKIEAFIVQEGYTLTSLKQADFAVRFRYGTGPMGIRAEAVTEPVPGPAFYTGWGLGYGWPGGWYGWYGWERPVVFVEHRFFHGLLVYAYKAARYREGKRDAVWVGECTARSRSPDLRAALPVMLEALFARFGTDTKKGVTVRVEEDP